MAACGRASCAKAALTGTTSIYDALKKCPNFSSKPIYSYKAGTQRRSIFVTTPKEEVLAKERIRYYSFEGEGNDPTPIGYLGICAL